MFVNGVNSEREEGMKEGEKEKERYTFMCV